MTILLLLSSTLALAAATADKPKDEVISKLDELLVDKTCIKVNGKCKPRTPGKKLSLRLDEKKSDGEYLEELEMGTNE